MALRGNLKDFSLPDVFQLVTFSKKTGVLRIKRADGAEGSVWFRDGEVFFAQSNWHGELLGERMVHANRITPSALAKALDIREAEPEGARRLGQILVDEGYTTEKVLEAFVQEQIQDTIFDLMRWDEGEFDFELLPDVVHEDIGLSVSIENVIMEGSRRLEEWTRIKKKIPSMDIVFKMATAPGEGTFEISLKPIEWNLLLLVDGTRSVSELARQTNRTDFEVSRIMYGLFSAGLLEVAEDEEVERLRAERSERDKLLEGIRAKEAEVQKKAAQEAIAREEALAAQAKARIESEKEAVEEAVEEAAEVEERPEPEVPEFLVPGTGAEATAEDMAIFEEMMEAVLEAPAEEAPAEIEEAAAAPEPVLEPSEPVAAVQEPSLAEPVAEPVPEEEAAGDFQADLMALGLGELPAEEVPAPEVEEAPGLEPQVPAGMEAAGEAEEPMILEAPAELEAFLKDLEPVEEAAPAPPSAVDEDSAVVQAPEAVPAVEQPTPEGIVEEVVAELGLAPEEAEAEVQFITPEPEIEAEIEVPSEGEGAPDLSDILSSLEEEAEAEPPEIVATSNFDEELGEAGAPSAGVISTDAFLADISTDGLDVGLSSGLGDELSALTGAGGRSRPSASVNKIPEPGQPMELRRDQTVDKDLVLKIIKGIENL